MNPLLPDGLVFGEFHDSTTTSGLDEEGGHAESACRRTIMKRDLKRNTQSLKVWQHFNNFENRLICFPSFGQEISPAAEPKPQNLHLPTKTGPCQRKTCIKAKPGR